MWGFGFNFSRGKKNLILVKRWKDIVDIVKEGKMIMLKWVFIYEF